MTHLNLYLLVFNVLLSDCLFYFSVCSIFAKVLKGTHKCGRIDHGKTGGQQGADAERVELLKKQYHTVHVDLQPGK